MFAAGLARAFHHDQVRVIELEASRRARLSLIFELDGSGSAERHSGDDRGAFLVDEKAFVVRMPRRAVALIGIV